jgi:hypothetical protein
MSNLVDANGGGGPYWTPVILGMSVLLVDWLPDGTLMLTTSKITALGVQITSGVIVNIGEEQTAREDQKGSPKPAADS